MKNNYFIFTLCFFLFFGQNLYAESFQFDVKDISIEDKGNIIFANDGKVVSKNKNLEIIAKKYKYIKSLDQLESNNGIIFIKNENIKIKFNQIKLNNKNNIITASNGIEIEDLKKSLNIQGQNIIFDRDNNFLFSKTTTIITDKYKNQINTKKFDSTFLYMYDRNDMLKIISNLYSYFGAWEKHGRFEQNAPLGVRWHQSKQ